MIIVAAAAGTLLGTAALSSASAEPDVHFNINLGGDYLGYYPDQYSVYPSYPVVDENDDYGNADCGYEYIPVKKWNRYHDHFRIVYKRVWVCN